MCQPINGQHHVCKCGTCTCKSKENKPKNPAPEKENSKKS